MTTAIWSMPRDMTRFSTLEAAMMAALHAAGLPEPTPEYRFDRRPGCCAHEERHHRPESRSTVQWIFPACWICADQGTPEERQTAGHAFKLHRRARKWRFDFAWPDLKLAVECEGGTFAGGRHTTGAGFEKDTEKYNSASVQGWTVLRFTQRQITSGQALELVERALKTGGE